MYWRCRIYTGFDRSKARGNILLIRSKNVYVALSHVRHYNLFIQKRMTVWITPFFRLMPIRVHAITV